MSIMSDRTIFISRNEGLKLKPYRCTKGKLTIGYGRNLEERGITEEEARYLLRNDILEAELFLSRFLGDSVLRTINAARMTVLVDMYVNMGPTRLQTFKKMFAAIRDQNWHEAAAQLKDSKYYREDVPKRAERNRRIMEAGEL